MTRPPGETAAAEAGGTVPAEPLLALAEATTGYGRTVVVRGISMTVGQGQVAALVGVNGSGKSTTLRMISGLLPTMSGTVHFSGADVSSLPAHERSARGICHITDSRAIFPALTVEENIRLHVGGKRRAAREAVEYTAEVFPRLADRRRQLAGTLSGGEQQMLALTRAYVTKPRLLLLDELSMGLAPIVIDEIYDAISRLTAEGLATLIVEQYIKRILPLAGTVYVMSRGEITASGAVGDLEIAGLVQGYLTGDGPDA
jgi:branched-chain amino acid transport system ATP-binding protein